MKNEDIWIDDYLKEGLGFDPLNNKDSGISFEKGFVSFDNLIKEVKEQKCKKFKMYLNSAYLGYTREIEGSMDFASHVERINNADLKYPIILNEVGFCIDGQHRIVKALLKKKKWIWAYRLVKPISDDKYCNLKK